MGGKEEDNDDSPFCGGRYVCRPSDVGLYMQGMDATIPIDKILEEIPNVNPQHLFNEASRFNLVDRMDELFSNNCHKIDINGRSTITGHTPLTAACDANSVNAVKWLLQHDANPNSLAQKSSKDHHLDNAVDTVSSLWLTAGVGNVRSAKLLLDAGADVNTYKKSTGTSPLFIAAQNGHKAMISLLLSFNADINNTVGVLTTNSINKTLSTSPILIAVAGVRIEIVAQLINGGAEFSIYTDVIKTILTQTRLIGKTATLGYERKVTKKEIDVLEELLDVQKVKSIMSNPTYDKARKAERKRDYREAIKLLQQLVPTTSSKMAQLRLDIDRNIEFVYGMKGSDGRISVWDMIAPPQGAQPESLQFNAWARLGRNIYMHGGYDFMEKDFFKKRPILDEVWQLNIDTRKWKLMNTKGKSPGPRFGHAMFIYKNAIYVWGGDGTTGIIDTKLYRLDLGGVQNNGGIYNWEIVKTKGSLRPLPRKEFAGVLYRGKYYITGGDRSSGDTLNDLWCINLSNLRWSQLKDMPNNYTGRHCHRMWAARGKLFVFGGRVFEEGDFDIVTASHSIDDFVAYDIANKSWSDVPVCGDNPHDISEFCALPIFGGGGGGGGGEQNNNTDDEPTSVIVWGGYSEADYTKAKGPITLESLIGKYGEEEAFERKIPYRKRLFRYDIDMNVWTNLNATKQQLPKAESYAAEIESKNGQIKLLIGGGYGYTTESKKLGAEYEAQASGYNGKSFIDIIEKSGAPADEGGAPEASQNMYEVSIADVKNLCSVENDFLGKSWSWDFFDLGEQRPSIKVDISPWSPTLHNAIDMTYEDFNKNRQTETVQPDDEENILGVRVELHGLKGSADLNGAIGRCGNWLKQRERYQVFLPSYYRGPSSAAVKPANLRIAEAKAASDVAELVAKNSIDSPPPTFPSLSLGFCMLHAPQFKRISPLEYMFEVDADPENAKIGISYDIYYGPVSMAAQVVLRKVCDTSAGKLSCAITPEFQGKEISKEGSKEIEKTEPLKMLYERRKEQDSRRVVEFENHLFRSRNEYEATSIEWFKLTVKLDGIIPPIERELIVSPDISMQELHNHVLCPTIGWTSNYHCHAFRRIHKISAHLSAWTDEADEEAMRMTENECWIGPNASTAADVVFQPLYLGGALANSKKIMLRDLFGPHSNHEMYLQYVYDFGDWWSHTIHVTKFEGQVPKNASVAYLLSGSGGGPPEDIGGVSNYANVMSQLCGKVATSNEAEKAAHQSTKMIGPVHENWWKLLNSEVRAKPNVTMVTNPLEFDIEFRRSQLHSALRCRLERNTDAISNFSNRCVRTGLIKEKKAPNQRKIDDPTKLCAVCEVTVALKLCSKCKSVAFCCRDHIVAFWPTHKKDCKRIQKERKENLRRTSNAT